MAAVSWNFITAETLRSTIVFFGFLCTIGCLSGAALHGAVHDPHALHAFAEGLRALGGESARIDPHPGKLRRQPSVLDLRTAVHHHLEAGLFGEKSRLVIAHGELHPDHLRPGPERQRLLHDGQHVLGGTEDVDHVDRLGDFAKVAVDFLPDDLLAGLMWINRDHPVATFEQILEREKARPIVLRRDADHGDGLHRLQNAADIAVGIDVVVHAAGSDLDPSNARIRAFSASSWAILVCTVASASSISASVKRVTMCEEQFTSQASMMKR